MAFCSFTVFSGLARSKAPHAPNKYTYILGTGLGALIISKVRGELFREVSRRNRRKFQLSEGFRSF